MHQSIFVPDIKACPYGRHVHPPHDFDRPVVVIRLEVMGAVRVAAMIDEVNAVTGHRLDLPQRLQAFSTAELMCRSAPGKHHDRPSRG